MLANVGNYKYIAEGKKSLGVKNEPSAKVRWSTNSIQTRGSTYGIKRSNEAEWHARPYTTLFTDT